MLCFSHTQCSVIEDLIKQSGRFDLHPKGLGYIQVNLSNQYQGRCLGKLLVNAASQVITCMGRKHLHLRPGCGQAVQVSLARIPPDKNGRCEIALGSSTINVLISPGGRHELSQCTQNYLKLVSIRRCCSPLMAPTQIYMLIFSA